MQKLISAVWVIMMVIWAQSAQAQQAVWVQIEAKPSLREAQERIAAYSGFVPDVNGFALQSGWYAIALGPYPRADATTLLSQLKLAGRIPADSFIAFGNSYQQQFWPVGAGLLAPVAPQAPVIGDTAALPQEAPVLIEPADETPAEARRSEARLTRAEREELQIALQWEGFYNSRIDGAFGAGTRRSMGAWQEANGYEVTGILTTVQRAALVQSYDAVLSEIGMAPLREETAGIAINMPLGLVQFDRYEPPFAHFTSKDDSGVGMILISQSGDQQTLTGLYNILQTLEIVPPEGARDLKASSFTLNGADATLVSDTYAELRNGQVKGYILTWPANGDMRKRALVLEELRASFKPLPDAVLPDAHGDSTQSIDLMAGLEIRRADRSASGFYVDEAGHVLTAASVVERCARITLDEDTEATIIGMDTGRGLALLAPAEPLSPMDYVRFQPSVPRLQSEIAVAGFSYGGRLNAASMTFGSLAELGGLNGELNLQRLVLNALPGDAGGPVYDATGSVLGLLMPHDQGARKLPEDVSFAVDTMAIAEFLSQNGLSAAASDATEALAPEDLTIRGQATTVLVGCWQ